jgi:uncharacterized repeat protein (TIGR01451 family)
MPSAQSCVASFLFLISCNSPLAAADGTQPLLIGTQHPPIVAGAMLGSAQTAVGDFNHDGKVDLMVVETATGQLRVLNGDGAGSFTTPGSTFQVPHPYAIAVMDFDGDGNLDIAVTSYLENCVTILLGDGRGGFTKPSWGTIETGRLPLAIAGADFNGDGRPDLAVSNLEDGSITILLWNSSAGRFQQAAGSPFRVGKGAYRLTAADFDGDGHTDLAIALPQDRTVGIWRGLGDGTFQQAAGSPVSVASVPRSLAAADFNGDGRMDIAVLGDDLRVLVGDGAGGFTLSDAFLTGGTNPQAMAAADFDADGKTDLAVTNGRPGNVGLLLGDGTGGFSAPVTFPAGNLPGWIAVADLNGDSRLDLAVGSDEGVQVLLSAAPPPAGVSGIVGVAVQSAAVAGERVGPASTSAARSQPSATASTVSLTASPNPATYGQAVSLTATITAGATGKVTFYDGITVLGVSIVTGGTASLSTGSLRPGSRKLRAYYGGDATYSASASSSVIQTVNVVAANVFAAVGLLPGAGLYAGSVAAGDLNRDGKADLVLASNLGLTILLGNGDATFPTRLSATGGTGFTSHQVALADFNGDGILDVAVVKQNPNSVLIMLGNGNGTFQAPTGYGTAYVPLSVLVGDFNRDGKVDLAVLDQFNVNVFLGIGDGGFHPPVQYAISGFNFDVGIGDFDGDGKADLVVATELGISVLFGNGDGTLRAPVSYSIGQSWAVAVGDFNGDGLDDLAVAVLNGVAILLANSDATFQPATYYGLGSFVGWLVAGDFNGDGKPDLAAGSEQGNGVNVLPGNGDGTFGPPIIYPGGVNPNSVVAGDFNRDGRTDIAIADVTGDGSASVTILLGVSATMTPVGPVQSAPLGGPFASALEVYVKDTGGNPVSGVTVTFSSPATGAGATLSNSTAVTNGAGLASVTATANNTAGNYSIVASAGAMTASLPLTNYAATPASLTPASGTPQSAATGMPFPLALKIVLKDPGGRPVSGASIGFAVPANGAAALLSNTSAVTDASGLAQVWATANNTAGSYSVVASLGALSTAFVLTNLPPVQVSLATSPNPSVLGRSVSLTVTVPSGTSGKVTFYDGTAMLGVADIISRTASFSTVSLPAGTRNLRAYYRGDLSHPANVSNIVSQTVNPVPVSTFAAGSAYSIPGTFASGSYPNFVAVADFNGDGKADLAVANMNSFTTGSVTILIGNGDGTFQAGINTSLSGWASSVAVGDFDGDGKTDLAVSMSNNNAVTILLGNGDGTFRVGTTYVVGNRPYNIAAGDFNRDGYPDLVVSNYPDTTVSVLLGNGDGTFRQAVQYNSGAANSQSVAIADFNGDGIADIAVGTDSNYVGILLGNGDGSFQVARTYSAAPFAITAATSVVAGDFNGDGKMDLATVGVYCWSILLGNGDGSFQAPLFTQYPTWTATPVIGDFNADGKLDLAFSYGNSGSQGIGILFGNGNGTFQAPLTFPGASSFSSVAAGEFNGDGRPDLVLLDGPNRAVRLLLGAVPALNVSMTHTSGFFQGQSGATYSITVTNNQAVSTAGAVTVTDTMPAGLTAISISGEGWGCAPVTLTCARSDSLAPGAAYPAITVTVDVASNAPSQVVNQVSLSGGGAASASATDPTSISVPIMGTTTTLTASPSPSNLGQDVTLTATVTGGPILGKVTFYDGASILGVGTLDFITHLATLTTNLLPAGTRTLHAHYGGDGIDAPSTSAPITETVRAAPSLGFVPSGGYGVPGNADSIAVGDFDRNGKTDIAIANGSGVSILLGNGDASFQQPVNYTANAAAYFVTLGDFNGDGKTDLVTANPANNNISVFLGKGDGSFQPPVNYSTGSGPNSVAVGDLDGDGATDLAVANSASNTVTIFLGNGDGTFRSLVSYPVGSSPYSVTMADFNGDSKPDLALTSWAGSVSVLLGNGDGTFQAAVNFPAGSNPVFVAAGDFNGDGKPDLAVANGGGSNISVLIGKGDGTFQPTINYPAGSSPTSLAIGDFNGDGKQDVAVGTSGNGVSMLLGNGDGTFRAATGYSAGSSVTSIGVGDFNGDGKTDLAIAIGNSAIITQAKHTNELIPASASAGSNNVLILQGGAIPQLSVSVTHAANFARGQNGATFTIMITNIGGVASSGVITAVDTLPSGLTATNISGAGWTCTLGTLSCTRSEALLPGNGYPAITVTVSVSANATSPLVNTAGVSGGGSAPASASDPAVVYAPTTAAFVKTDTTTQGTWKSMYGAEGEVINGDTASYPNYAQVSFNGGPFVWVASTADVRGLQKVAASDRIASGWYSWTNMTIDVNLTDGNTHQIALYCLDWDAGARAERIDVLDAISNAVLDTRTISGFQGGQYLVWNLMGHVILKVTLTGGSNAVVSGVFFGASSGTPTATAAFVKTDATTQGTWKSVYGAEGEVINGDTASYPSYAQVSFNGGPFVWGASTADVRGLQKASASDRIASGWYSWTNMTVDVNLTDGNTHQIALYCLDWDAGARAERIDVLDAVSNSVLDTRTISGFQNGQYLVWNLTGHVKLNVTLTGGSNAVVSGVFFGASSGTTTATAAFVKTDTTTQGTWKSGYGSDGEVINGDTASYPSYAQVSFNGGPFVWVASTADVRGLQKVAATDRIASGWYSWTNMTIDVNLTDGNTHQVALYCLDWDAGARAERIDVLDAVSNAVLDTRTISGFQNGQYLVWNLKGHVKLNVTLTGGSNAVVSGVFFGGSSGTTTATAAFVKTDSTTQGTWKTVYGADGEAINGDTTSYPSYAQVSFNGGPFVWVASTADVRGLQKAAVSDRIASGWYSWTNMSIDVNLTDENAHQVALYCLDWDAGARAERIDVLDAVSNAVLDTRTISGFQSGQYLVWNLTGHVKLKVTLTGGSNAVVSGVFFR